MMINNVLGMQMCSDYKKMHKLVWRGGDSLRVLAVFQGEQSSIPNTILHPPTLAPNDLSYALFRPLWTPRHT